MLKGNLLEKFVPILLVLTVALAFLVGLLWQKVSLLEKGGTSGTQQAVGDTNVPTDVNGKLSDEQAKAV